MIILLLMAAVAGAAVWWHESGSGGQDDSIPGGGIACTADAKICPDGSAVGRTAPDCQFAPCPGEDIGDVQASGIRGSVLLGPNCPVMRNPPDPQCADKPYAASLEVTSADGSNVIGEFRSTAGGQFSVQLPPGDYAIRSAEGVRTPPVCSSRGLISVTDGAMTEAVVYCDTGIR